MRPMSFQCSVFLFSIVILCPIDLKESKKQFKPEFSNRTMQDTEVQIKRFKFNCLNTLLP